jgi:hypothetical protein
MPAHRSLGMNNAIDIKPLRDHPLRAAFAAIGESGPIAVQRILIKRWQL